MKKAILLYFVLVAAVLAPLASPAAPVPPIVTNVVSAQRPGTFFVDVTYDLLDPDSWAVFISAEFSTNGGASYLPTVFSTTGDVGSVVPGLGKRFVWNAWNDWAGNYTTNARVRLTANDTANLVPPPTNMAPATNLCWIPPGAFNMSGTMVSLTKGFFMGKYEVTQAEYQQVMGTNPSYFAGNPRRPVERVNWYDAVQYCQQLTTNEQAAGRLPAGWAYRLPTEAEWEYACRAGTTNDHYYGDDPNSTRLTYYAWYGDNSGGQTHDVGLKLCNRWGLHDMYGNVFEWCSDWFAELPGGNVTDPQGPFSDSSGLGRVLRGGCWMPNAFAAYYCRSDYRWRWEPGVIYTYSYFYVLGFRVVLAPSP
jgi:formylglycine-generating enzyme required for sulfatase activity